MSGDYGELTLRSNAHAIMRADLHRSQRNVFESLPEKRPVVARNLTFEDRRHARTSRIDFLAVGDWHLQGKLTSPMLALSEHLNRNFELCLPATGSAGRCVVLKVLKNL
jgi:hypothetical protein